MLTEVQRLPTSGARAVEVFTQDGQTWLAVAQLACDIPGQPPAMTQGDSDTEMLVYRWQDGGFTEHQRLPVPGGEDAEAFMIGGRRFLATASLRRGAGPYELQLDSVIFEWRGGRFEPFQRIPTTAAKQWTHVQLGGRHFLLLAQGVRAGHDGERGAAGPAPKSTLFEWTGERFEAVQEIAASAWGYNALPIEVGGEHLLAYADHAEPSVLLRWNGARFEPFQVLEGASGRAFCCFQAHGERWLAFANLLGDTLMYRWAGARFEVHQRLSGPGGREFEWLPDGRGGGRLVQVNFIHGSREAPQPVLDSFVHAWGGGSWSVVERFATSGGTDACAFEVGGARYLAVSNSLDAAQRFRVDSCIYRVEP